MSAETEKGLELKVGIFVFIGLLFIAAMAVKFGQIGQGFKKFYSLTVELPNASGLIKNSDVQLAGARIGYVADKPQITPSVASVTVSVKVAEGIKIPRNSHFQVNSSGLLGDKFIEIIPNSDFDSAKFNPDDPAQIWNPGEKVQGSKTAGLDLETLQKKAETLFDQLGAEVNQLKDVTVKINQGVLSDTNQKNISETLSNLKTTSEQFQETTKNLDSVITGAQEAVDSAKKTLGTVDAAAGDSRKVLETARGLLSKAQTGEGTIATLLNNRELSDNLKALITNLREHGILFYKNKPAAGVERRPTR